MKLWLKLSAEKANEIREAISEEFEEPSEGYWDGNAFVSGDNKYSYVTGTGMGDYTLLPSNSLYFQGRRNSFLSGTMLFFIEKSDVLGWQILDSRQLDRSPWEESNQ